MNYYKLYGQGLTLKEFYSRTRFMIQYAEWLDRNEGLKDSFYLQTSDIKEYLKTLEPILEDRFERRFGFNPNLYH